MEKFVLGQEVVRIGRSQVGHGRVGIVIQINNYEQRARVRWFKEKSGKTINIRTWVSFRSLTTKNFL